MEKKIIIITGASGFIGSNIFKYYEHKNFNFILISSTFKSYSRKRNITYINKNNTDKIVHLLDKIKKIDFVFFAHGEINHKKSLTLCKKDHFYLTKLIFNNIKYKDIKKIIYFGSSEEYGSIKSPIREVDIGVPLTNYAKVKSLNTSYLINNSLKYNINTTVLRLFLVYGPGQKQPRLIPYLLNCLLKNKIAELKSINSIKDFLHIDDLILNLNKIIVNKKTNCQIFNIGSGTKLSMKDVLYIFKHYGLDFNVVNKSRSSEVLIQYPSLRKINNTINYKVNISLAKGIKKLLK